MGTRIVFQIMDRPVPPFITEMPDFYDWMRARKEKAHVRLLQRLVRLAFVESRFNFIGLPWTPPNAWGAVT